MEQIAVDPELLSRKRTRITGLLLFAYTLIITGLIISFYLFYRYWLLTTNTTGNVDFCSAVFGKGCDSALKSNVSGQLGLPLSAWGIIYYGILLTTIIAGRSRNQTSHSTANVMLLLFTFTGCLVSLTLLCMMIIDPTLFCPFCITLHLINLILFIALNKMISMSQESFWQNLRAETMALFKKGKDRNKKRWLIGVILLIGLLLYGGLYTSARKAETLGSVFSVEKILAAYDAAPVVKIPVDTDDPVTGNVDAPIEVITFSDFQCKSCQSFSFVIRRMDEKFPGKLKVVFKYFPLGMACNSNISEDLHPRACEAAWAAEAARTQGKFWEFHNIVFRYNLNNGDRTLCSFADSVGLDHAKFETYRTSKAAMDKVARTVEQAKKLGVDGTPAIFVNGKEITDFRPVAFEPLIKHILENPKLQQHN